MCFFSSARGKRSFGSKDKKEKTRQAAGNDVACTIDNESKLINQLKQEMKGEQSRQQSLSAKCEGIEDVSSASEKETENTYHRQEVKHHYYWHNIKQKQRKRNTRHNNAYVHHEGKQRSTATHSTT